ncbi:MAG: DUF2877 domain-containing protein [Anaerolineales bacterium]|nr:DUF2877 domain-containing protein [Anaerolineales bacterium]
MKPLKVTHAGEYALEILQAGASGEVLASVSSAVYLSTAQDEILWLGSEHVPLHRRGMRLEGLSQAAVAGRPFRTEGGSLLLNDFRVEFNNAHTWQAPELAITEPIHPKTISERLLAFCCSYTPRHTDGFGALVGTIVGRIWPERFTGQPSQSNRIQAYAQPTVEAIIDHLLAADVPGTLDNGERIIGLGPGLTPSGDDYLGGLLFAIYHVSRACEIQERLPVDQVQTWLTRARGKTHPISYTLLADHASGYGAEELYRFVFALFSQAPIEEVVMHASRLELIGSTTGSDLVAGVITGLLFSFFEGESD